ncbi:helix-turn-helix domain-containing protein [Peribacillus muralis]|uniref:helix-turn-helix domain-containing protein n=1 Tax=Peribacillus muralis TaxID=264697 RepID=UPI00381497B4
MDKFGDYIKEKRTKAGLTISDLAKASTVSQPYLSQIEAGKRRASIQIVNKLAKALGVDQFELAEKAGYYTAEEIKQRKELEAMELDDELKEESFKWLLPATDESLKEYCHLIFHNTNTPFSGALENEFWSSIDKLLSKYPWLKIDKKIDINKKGYIDEIANALINTGNVQFKLELLKELQRIAHEYHLKFDPTYKEDLSKILKKESLYFNGVLLSERDKERIKSYLEIKYKIAGDE